MVQMKKKLIQLLQELVEKKSLRPEIQIISKGGKKNHVQLKKLTSSSITRRINTNFQNHRLVLFEYLSVLLECILTYFINSTK